MTKPDKTNKGSSALRELLSWIQIIVIAAVVAFVLNNFLIANSRVPTGSMENTIMTGDRVIGMQGDKVTIRDGHVYLNDSETPLEEPYIKEPMVVEPEKTFQVPEGAYFCMGDNRNESMDARYWKNSYVYKNKILAKVLFRYWPGIKGIH